MSLSFRSSVIAALLLGAIGVMTASVLAVFHTKEYTVLATSSTEQHRSPGNSLMNNKPVSQRLIETFDYTDDEALRQAWHISTSGNATVSLETNDGINTPSLRIDSDLPCTSCGCSEGRYVIASRHFDSPQDWTDAISLTISARGDGLADEPYGGEFSVILWDSAGTAEEQWRSTRFLERATGWQTFTMTLVGAGQGNAWEHPDDFVIPSWETPQNGTLDLDSISRIGIEASTTIDDCEQHPAMSAWVDTIALIEPLAPPTVTPTPTMTPTATPTIPPTESEPVLLGAAAATYWFGDPDYADTLAREFDLLTTERQMQFDIVQPAEGEFDFTEPNGLVQFAINNDLLVRGHTLVWHETLPAWLDQDLYGSPWGDCYNPANYPLSREELMDILETHIKTVMGRYKGQIYAWDVVNEAIAHEDEDILDGDPLRPSIWRCGIGDDYVKLAFQWAREADPDALLFYNEYRADFPGPKADAVYDLVADLAEENLIDGVGLHLHLSMHNDPDTDWNDIYVPTYDEVTTVMRRLEALGLIVHMTEIDVHMNADEQVEEAAGALYEQRLIEQAAVYREIARACRDVPACETFVTWGFTDAYTWLDINDPNDPSDDDDPPAWPLPFDENYNPKPAYEAVLEVLSPEQLPVIISPVEVMINGAGTGQVNGDYTFTAYVTPTHSTIPLTYTWQATDQEIIQQQGALSDTVTFRWNSPGMKTVDVTVENQLRSATTTYTIEIRASPTESPDLSINFETGSPGSFFTVRGSNFPVSTIMMMDINDTPLDVEAATDNDGNIIFILDTSNADPGRYTVTVSPGTHLAQAIGASVSFALSNDAPLRARETDIVGTEVIVPAGIAMDDSRSTVYLPLITR
jgi:endo-1,4-beta-xylanase